MERQLNYKHLKQGFSLLEVGISLLIVSITFLEDTTLTALTPATDMLLDGTTGADLAGSAISFGSTTAKDVNGANAAEIDASTIFPRGLTIYGRWSSVDPSSASTTGGIICYFGY